MKIIGHRKSQIEHAPAFTLIELLVVIAVIGVLAAFTLTALKSVKRTQYLQTARGELEQIQAALDNYKARYGFYPPGNQNAASANYIPAALSQLYYELSGVTNNVAFTYFSTLDGSSQIKITDMPAAYGVNGFVNCTKGSGEDAVMAKNFLPDLKPNRIFYPITNNTVPTTVLITSVRGPDVTYQPLGVSDVNPFRYRYPGVNNPNSYDLWIKLVISGQTNLICNWSRQVQINSSLP